MAFPRTESPRTESPRMDIPRMDMPVSSEERPIYLRWPVVSALLGLTFLAVLSTQFLEPAVPAVQQSDVWVSEVRQGKFTREVRGIGTLVPSEVRWIAAASPGRVERVLVQPGATVQADTIIAELSNPELVNQLERARWELDAAQANLLALKAQLQEQALEYELYTTQAVMALETARLKERAERQLADKQIISALDFETTLLNTRQKETELEIRQQARLRGREVELAKLSAEEANVRRFQNMVSHYESQLANLKITADIHGVLQELTVDIGQRVDVGGNIARVAQPDSLLAEIRVQENLVQDLQTGMAVIVDTRSGLVDGRVKRIDPRVLEGNVQVDVELVGELPKGARPDLSVSGTVIVDEVLDAVFIERPVGASAHSATELFILSAADSKAIKAPVQFGKASVSTIQVLAGLSPGDTVIISDMSEFQQHSAVQVLR